MKRSLLGTGSVAYLSIDHDLGDGTRGIGYDFIFGIEEALVT